MRKIALVLMVLAAGCAPAFTPYRSVKYPESRGYCREIYEGDVPDLEGRGAVIVGHTARWRYWGDVAKICKAKGGTHIINLAEAQDSTVCAGGRCSTSFRDGWRIYRVK